VGRRQHETVKVADGALPTGAAAPGWVRCGATRQVDAGAGVLDAAGAGVELDDEALDDADDESLPDELLEPSLLDELEELEELDDLPRLSVL